MSKLNNLKTNCVIRVVDDDPDVRKAITFLLENEDWKVKAFSSGEAFLVEEASLVPGCIILDIKMKGLSGLDVFEELRTRESKVPVIFLTAHGDVPMAVNAIKDGAVEFLLKPLDPEKLLELVEKYCQLDVAGRNLKFSISEAKARIASLSVREKEILQLVLKDLSNQEIADALMVKKRTVESHRLAAYKKLGVNSVKELIYLFESIKP